jgi:predicted DNA-binding transcriptional regulator AlpA
MTKHPSQITSADELLTPPEASRSLKVSLSWLAKARLYGTGPVYRKVGRSVRYLRSDLERYLAARVRTSTSQI